MHWKIKILKLSLKPLLALPKTAIHLSCCVWLEYTTIESTKGHFLLTNIEEEFISAKTTILTFKKTRQSSLQVYLFLQHAAQIFSTWIRSWHAV